MNEQPANQTLSYERLDAYRLALDFHRSLVPLARGPQLSALRDQMLRAAESIVLNIAEGAGRTSPPDKRRFYSMARGSAMETAACLDLLRNRNALPEPAHQLRRAEALRIIRILSRLAGPPR